MSRRDNADRRCARCRMHDVLCVCAMIPRLSTRTRLVVLIHRLEDRKTTNTGRLAALCLENSEVIVRGHAGEPTAPLASADGSSPLLLFPSDDAIPITSFAGSSRPLTLIVPDGTWRQASKVRRRVPGLLEVPCVTLPPGEASAYRLRHEPRDGGLATAEAVARAFGILEGPHVREAIERVFVAVVERTLWSRGLLRADEVASGVPEPAFERAMARGDRG